MTAPGGLDAFAERGHAVLRDALPAAEIAAAAEVLRGHVRERHGGLSPFERALGASAMRTVFDLALAPAAVRALVCSPALGRIAAAALGTSAVRVLHFNGFYKPGPGLATPWHQDLSYIPLDSGDVLTLWLPLVEVTAEMGALCFAAGSHQGGAVDLEGIERRFPLTVNPPLRPGDLSLHHGWTAHRSAANSSDRTREAVAISYFADGARVRGAEGGPPMMASLLAEALPGLEPGDLARGAKVPLVYPPDPACREDPR